jgi:hypothetical protein
MIIKWFEVGIGIWLLITLWAWGPTTETLFFWSVLVSGVLLVIIAVWPTKEKNNHQGRLE